MESNTRVYIPEVEEFANAVKAAADKFEMKCKNGRARSVETRKDFADLYAQADALLEKWGRR